MRANYQTMIWQQAHITHPHIPHPSGHGWTMSSDEVLVIDWCDDPVPLQLVDILHTRTEEETNTSDNTDSTEEESDLESCDYDEDDFC